RLRRLRRRGGDRGARPSGRGRQHARRGRRLPRRAPRRARARATAARRARGRERRRRALVPRARRALRDPNGAAVSEWWRDAVVYEIYVRSFADSDGDGIGDLPGIRARLDHVAGLGVDAIWLTPFYPSPDADFGYDVADYCDVDPRLGTLADFDALLADAHA